MKIYKLTPDKTVKYQIDDSGKIVIYFGNEIYRTKALVADNAILTRSYLYRNEILDDGSEAYVLEYHPLNGVLVVVFDKDDWKQQWNGCYIRQIKEMYCDENGLKTIWEFKEISLLRGGFLTPSNHISHEKNALRELKGKSNAMAVLRWLGNENYLDFLIKHKEKFKQKNYFEQGLYFSVTSVNMNMISKYYSTDILLQLLKEADKEKLRECGDLFEPKGEVVAYRGVPNKKEEFKINRISWTLDFEIAEFFAKNCSRRDRRPDDIPAVYKVTVPPEAIFFYTNDRNEQEVVIDPELCGTIEELPTFSEQANSNLLEQNVVNF